MVHDTRTFGERLADKIAAFGGSWKFIILFGGFIFLWCALNTVLLWAHPVDPYPYIFLNLILSMLAALQAPVIMMSQNRQAAKDRITAELDYNLDLKAEEEIRIILNEVHLIFMKINHLDIMKEIQ
jgi:uncharacterized membrane protein